MSKAICASSASKSAKSTWTSICGAVDQSQPSQKSASFSCRAELVVSGSSTKRMANRRLLLPTRFSPRITTSPASVISTALKLRKFLTVNLARRTAISPNRLHHRSGIGGLLSPLDLHVVDLGLPSLARRMRLRMDQHPVLRE